ncbi:unnamed protein product [Caretta caretta]
MIPSMSTDKHKSGGQKHKLQQACVKDQKNVNGLQSFLKCVKYKHVPGEQATDNSAVRISEPSLSHEDIDFGLSGFLGVGVPDSSIELGIKLFDPRV